MKTWVKRSGWLVLGWAMVAFGQGKAVQQPLVVAADANSVELTGLSAEQVPGAVVYRRDVVVPIRWSGRRVVLRVERASGPGELKVDGKKVGTAASLWTPQEFELPTGWGPGKHTIEIRILPRVDLGVGKKGEEPWTGVAGEVTLTTTALTWVGELKTFPEEGKVEVKGKVMSLAKAEAGALPVKREVTLRAGLAMTNRAPALPEVKVAVKEDGTFEGVVELGEMAETWDEFHPTLYVLTATLANGESKTTTFGVRRVNAAGKQLTINGRPLFLRGTLLWEKFPKSMPVDSPPTDVAEWKRMLGVAKSFGMNEVRCAGWCPPEAAFAAADEMGMYLHVEVMRSGELGNGLTSDTWVEAESQRMLAAYGNHPSFLLMTCGSVTNAGKGEGWLYKWVERRKEEDSRRLYAGAGGVESSGNQVALLPEVRIQQGENPLLWRLNALAPETTSDYRKVVGTKNGPVVGHEVGQWRAKEDAQRPMQMALYKEEIESALRTPGMAGFELRGLTDDPSGAAVGVVDALWKAKEGASAEAFAKFCGPTVVLARLPKRVFAAGELLSADVEAAHFGASAMEGAEVRWKIVSEQGEVVVSGILPTASIPLGNGTKLGTVKAPMMFDAPGRYRLVVGIVPKGGPAIENAWDMWVYPARPEPRPSGIAVASDWTPEVEKAVNEGGKVLLRIPALRVKGETKLAFSERPVVWEAGHGALAGFPAEGSWPWWYVAKRAGAMELPAEVKPVVAVEAERKRLGLLLEVRVGKALMVVTGIAMDDQDPVNRRMRESVLAYMNGEGFKPTTEMTKEQVKGLIGPMPARGAWGR